MRVGVRQPQNTIMCGTTTESFDYLYEYLLPDHHDTMGISGPIALKFWKVTKYNYLR